MKFKTELLEGRLIKRYKRFLVDVELTNGTKITAHCPNTGSMMGCAIPGSSVWLSTSENPSRKYKHTLEIVKVNNNYIGVNTSRPNSLVEEAIKSDIIVPFIGSHDLQREVKYGKENSRIDILLERDGQECYIEVKNVTLVEGEVAYFPDAVTLRGQKHIRELIDVVKSGCRGILFFCVQHTGAKFVEPADHIDEEYGKLLRHAVSQGVEVMSYQAEVTPEKIVLIKEIPTHL